MIKKSGMKRYLPIDTGKNAHLKEQAKKAYEHIYSSFAKYVPSTTKPPYSSISPY
jgi:hypothetical protein